MQINIAGMAHGIGISTTALYILIFATLIAVFMLYPKIKTDKSKNIFLLSVGALALFMVTRSGSITPDSVDSSDLKLAEGSISDWQESYSDWQESYSANARGELVDYEGDIENTEYYDYTHDTIASIASEIAGKAKDSKDAIILTLLYVYDNVDYTWTESDTACLSGTAPEILDKGTGQCDTQSIVTISILRKMGIAAKPVGGCIYPSSECRLQSILPFNIPKYVELTESLEEDSLGFARAGTLSRTGGLHAWVTAWLPESGWITLEPTIGAIADTQCWNYHVELFVENENKEELCISKSYNYAAACQQSNEIQLNKYGLGPVSEVSP